MGHLDPVTDKWVVDGKTDGGQEYNSVTGHLFTANGKWKYEVKLDYSDTWGVLVNGPEREAYLAEHPEDRRTYIDPNKAAWMALEKATNNHASDVTIKFNNATTDRWWLVVTDSPSGFPIMSDYPHREDPQ